MQEKLKGKSKLEPRLVGVTKDAFLSLDEKTTKIIRTWPLAQVKSWFSSQNVFTIDFGENHDCLYSAQTQEGDKISEVVAGYIDLIRRDDTSSGETEDQNPIIQISEPEELQVKVHIKVFFYIFSK